MVNLHTSNLINFHKNEIMNHFGPTFYMLVMNNNKFKTKLQWDTDRQKHGHAHLAVTKYEEENNFKQFANLQYYYVTSSVTEVNYNRCVTFREDLVLNWANSVVHDVRVLVLDLAQNQLYDIAVDDIVRLYLAKNCVIGINRDKLRTNRGDREYTFGNFRYVAFDLFDFEAEELDSSEYNGACKKEYVDARFIGNTVYTKYRNDTECFVAIYDKDGIGSIWQKDRAYRSLKEAYDKLNKVTSLGVSYKTFQRRFATGKPVITPNGFFVFVTDKVKSEADINVADYEEINKHIGKINKSNETIDAETIEEVAELDRNEKAEFADKIDQTSDGEKVEIIDFEGTCIDEKLLKRIRAYCFKHKLMTAVNEIDGSDIDTKLFYIENYRDLVENLTGLA